jgi:hypothetical protein
VKVAAHVYGGVTKGEPVSQPPKVDHVSRRSTFETAEQLAIQVRGKTAWISLVVWIVDRTWPTNLIATPFPGLKRYAMQYLFHGNSGSQSRVVNERHA